MDKYTVSPCAPAGRVAEPPGVQHLIYQGVSKLESQSPPNVHQMLLLAITFHMSSHHCNIVHSSLREADGGMGEEEGKELRSLPGRVSGRNTWS